jgi:hypothetical protein
MIEAGLPRHYLLVRRPWSPPEAATTSTPGTGTDGSHDDSSPDTSYVYCYVPPDSPIRSTVSNVVLMAGRRWPVEETIATGKGALGWDHHQFRTWTSLCHHTALCGLAMLKATVLRARLENITEFPSGTPTLPTDNITERPLSGDVSTPRKVFPRQPPTGSPRCTTR